jgi:hypothetical protein
MSDTAKTALIAGIFASLGGLGGALITGWSQVKLADQKFHSELILKALESGSAEERLESLKLLLATNLLKDQEIKNGVAEYAKAKEEDPSTIPQVATASEFEAPVISNPRIFLLSGDRSKEPLFAAYKIQLESAGYHVLGSKIIVDDGRPATEEVRFFHAEDQTQAEKIAEVIKFKLSVPQFPAKLYSDKSARPGYIEIWFGK